MTIPTPAAVLQFVRSHRKVTIAIATSLLVVAALGALAYARGRASASPAPAVVTTTAQTATTATTHEVEHRTTVKASHRVETRPDGTRIETTTDSATAAQLDAAVVSSTVASSSTSTTYQPVTKAPRWRVDVGPAYSFGHLAKVPGAPSELLRPDAVEFAGGVRLFGPVWLTGTVRTDRTAGLMLGATW